MKIGLGIGVTQPQNMPMASVGSPSYLFRDGAQGTWYDPSDINLTWRRNLLTYTEQFDNAAWVKTNTTISANTVVAPDGTSTTDKLIENTATGSHGTDSPSTAIISGTSYTASVYAKAGERRYLFLALNYSLFVSGNGVCFDLQSGTIVATGAGSSTAGAIYLSNNGFYRCSLTLTASASGTSAAVPAAYMSITPSSSIPIYTGDGTSGIYIWGAQLEQGSTATPYQRITDGIQDYLSYQAQPVLYRDAAGTLPVTAVEQPVGLMLDKSKGLVLGSELVIDYTQGYTAAGTTNVALSGTEVVATADGSSAAPGYYYAISTVVGQQYYVTGALRSPTTNTMYLSANHSASTNSVINRAGSYLATATQVGFFFTAIGTTTYIFVYGTTSTSGNQYAAKNISVKYRPGNHAFNSSGNSANFPVLSARYNLLTKTEDFSDAAWAKLGTVTRTPNYAVAPDGTTTAQRVVFSQNSSSDQFFQVVSVTSTTYSQGVWIKVPSGSALIRFGFYDGAIKTSALTLTTTWQYFTATQLLTAGAGARLMWLYPDGAGYATEIYVWHPDVRVSNDGVNLPAYQRVNTSTDYDTVGFKTYLRFNGVSQWLQTNSIDFTYGDKMFVSAGVRKLSDAAGVVLETSLNYNNNNGAILFYADTKFHIGEGGTAVDSSTYLSPITNVISCAINRAGTTAQTTYTRLGINGVDDRASYVFADNAGNYGNYPLYIGARAGSSLWFNGRLYGMVIAGKQVPELSIQLTEKYLNQKTGAY